MPNAAPSSLNDIEQRILDYMVSYLRANTYQPSIREIGERFGIRSTKTVSEHLQALAEKGYLERDPSRSRGVRILGVDLAAETVTVPVHRRLSADASGGSESVDAVLQLDRKLAGTGCFMVKARADELATLGIEEGDLVLLEPADVHHVADGSTVAYEYDGRAAYGRVRRVNGTLHLHSTRGTQSQPVVAAAEDVSISGRVVAFVRQFPEASLEGALRPH